MRLQIVALLAMALCCHGLHYGPHHVGVIDIDSLENEAILISAINGPFLGDGGDLTDAPLDTVLEAVKRDVANPHAPKHLFSIVSEDFRVGGTSDHSAVDHYVRHQDLKGVVVTTISGPTDSQDATFRLIPALCKKEDAGCESEKEDKCVSIMSTNFQGYYLKHDESAVSFETGDGTAAKRVALTFCMVPGLSNSDGGISFRVPGNSSQYLMHTGYTVTVGNGEASKAQATFRVRPGLFKGYCAGPDEPVQCTCQPGYLGALCDTPCPGLAIKNSMTTVCSNHGDCMADDEDNAICECHKGHLGTDCSLQCPMSSLNFEVCHGRGKCDMAMPAANKTNSDESPKGAVCECNDGYLGRDCSKRCPGANADCAGHGKCALSDDDQSALCHCDATHVGGDCRNECQKDGQGNICSGHGQCDDSDGQSSSGTICNCDNGWIGRLCGRECPRADNEAVCGGPQQGECQERPGHAICVCFSGFSGDDCGNATAPVSPLAVQPQPALL